MRTTFEIPPGLTEPDCDGMDGDGVNCDGTAFGAEGLRLDEGVVASGDAEVHAACAKSIAATRT